MHCGFDKNLYLTSCLNAHNHNTCIRLLQTRFTARKRILHYFSRSPNTSTCCYCHSNHNNNRLKFMISVILSPAKCYTASACNNPSYKITEIASWEQFDYYDPKQNGSPIIWRIWTSCTQPRFRMRDLHALSPKLPVKQINKLAITNKRTT